VLLLSELIGRPVLDVTGHESGRIRDFAARLSEPYPPVTRLLVRRGRGRRVIDWAQVSGLRDHAVELRSHLPEPGDGSLRGDEIWLAEHVLDTQVIDVAGRRLVRVGDVALERDAGSLRLAGVEIGKAAVLRRLGLRRLALRAGSELVDWRELHLTSRRGHELQLRTTAARVHRLTAEELDAVVARLPPHRASEVLEAVKQEGAEGDGHPRRRRYHGVLSARRRAPS
jgi:sporulation protein YlmC with PRC-barrel domain